jgi:16S rRNA (cytosine967-C5)-methyltransferase
MAKRSPLDAARQVAVDVLKEVRVNEAYANLALATTVKAQKLNSRDAAFATELVSGTLRWQGLYDEVIGFSAHRPVQQISAKVLDALRMGCHQLLGMRVPAHAATDTTVRWVRHEVGPGPAGFANAILRKVGTKDRESWGKELAPDPGQDFLGYWSVTTSHPRWMVAEFHAALAAGKSHVEDGELGELLRANNAAPQVTLVARPTLSTPEELPGEPGRWSPYAVLADQAPHQIPAIREGRAGVQDEGSQLVALALADAPINGSDKSWLDLCAGPGGKAALLAGLARQRGANLVAVEPHQHRADLVRQVVGSEVEVKVVDGRASGLAPGTQDRVLVDAPCTGLGALRRRPESRWRKHPEDLNQLTQLQRELLGAAIQLTRPGGVIAYATCSPVLAETGEIVAEVLESGQVGLINAEDVLPPELAIAGPISGPIPGTAQLWTHRHDTDAMFVALLRRDG